MDTKACYAPDMPVGAATQQRQIPRHSAVVRVTHWITAAAFLALLVTGIEILISHPRFYWGETGNSLTTPLFQIPIPSSRDLVPTRFDYVLPDQNGWSRYLHFQAAWAAVLTGLIYAAAGLWSGHFRKNLLPASTEWTWRTFHHADIHTYNPLQRVTYLTVIFVLFPLAIWTGLALSPAFDSAVPAAVTSLAGRQSARTLHFFVSMSLLIFFAVHIAMVALTGFRRRMRAMTTGRV